MNYVTHVFDMDGVLLASNGLKAWALHEAALPYGEEAAGAMVELHRRAGSISRRARVRRFFAEVLGLPEVAEPEIEGMVARIGGRLEAGYRGVSYVAGVLDYLACLERAGRRIVVVTGVEQDEARRILGARTIAPYLPAVYGSPPPKTERIAQLIEAGEIDPPAVYYGDEHADYSAAAANGLDFVLVSGDARWDCGGWVASQPRGLVQAMPDFTTAAALAVGGGAL